MFFSLYYDQHVSHSCENVAPAIKRIAIKFSINVPPGCLFKNLNLVHSWPNTRKTNKPNVSIVLPNEHGKQDTCLMHLCRVILSISQPFRATKPYFMCGSFLAHMMLIWNVVRLVWALHLLTFAFGKLKSYTLRTITDVRHRSQPCIRQSCVWRWW